MHLSRVRGHEPTAVTGEMRESAVVVPLLAGESRLLFTKRAEHLPNHPGQMSFPGGRCEPEDESLRETALREGHEEVGLDADGIGFVGRLDDIRTVTEFSVRPFVVRVPDRSYEPRSPEVAETAVLPVAALTDRDNYDSERRDHPHRGEIRLHYFRVDGYTVWGATARMLAQFLELVTDWSVPPEADRVVDPDAEFPV